MAPRNPRIWPIEHTSSRILTFQTCLVWSEIGFKTLRIAGQYSCHLSEAEAKRAQRHDLRGSTHLVSTIDPISGRRASWAYQFPLFIEAEGFGRNAKLRGRF